MNLELRALDLSRRRILLETGGRWYSSSEADIWKPVLLRDVEGVVALSEPGMIIVRREFDTFSELVRVVQEVLAKGPASPDLVQHWLGVSRRPAERSESSWFQDFPNIIHLFHDFVDELFADRGCSQEVSLRLATEVFNRLHLAGPCSDWSLPPILMEIAHTVYREVYGEKALEQRPRERAKPPRRRRAVPHVDNKPGKRRLRRALQALDRSTLRCLHMWTDSSFDDTAIAVILHFPADRVRIWLDLVAAKLGSTRQGLRDPRLLEAVTEQLAAGPNKHSARNRVS